MRHLSDVTLRNKQLISVKVCGYGSPYSESVGYISELHHLCLVHLGEMSTLVGVALTLSLDSGHIFTLVVVIKKPATHCQYSGHNRRGQGGPNKAS